MFKSLKINRVWRQFESIDLAFHDRLTVLTGVNGCGKTTILNYLATCFGHHHAISATLKRRDDLGNVYCSNSADEELTPPPPERSEGNIGLIEVVGAQPGTINAPSFPSMPTYSLRTVHQPTIFNGAYIRSPRPKIVHQYINSIDLSATSKREIASRCRTTSISQAAYPPTAGTPEHVAVQCKSVLLAAAYSGFESEAKRGNQELKQLFQDFQHVLKALFPKELGFKRLIVRDADLLIATKSDEFAFDAVSGGLATLIDIAWQLFLFADEEQRLVALIDEPENHLHPEMQQVLMPKLLEAFPKAQFIIATHSPLIVSSVRESRVYRLEFNEREKVYSKELSDPNLARTANEALTDILGLESTLPAWADEGLQRLIREFSQKEVTSDSLGAFRQALIEAGLEKFAPLGIANIFEATNEENK